MQAAQPPAQRLANGSCHERETDSFRANERVANREFSKNGSNRFTENIICALGAAVERLRNDADEGDRWADGVANRRVAATRIPAENALRREA